MAHPFAIAQIRSLEDKSPQHALTTMIHVSGPLPMVMAGLIIGNQLDSPNIKGLARKMLNEFWEVLDDVLNGILFVLIGLAFHLLEFNTNLLLLGSLAIFIVLVSRFVSVFIPYSLLKHKEYSHIKTVTILTLGGLRGGTSIALAMSLATNSQSITVMSITYIIGIFTIIV
jgi:Na+:H+ antiporter